MKNIGIVFTVLYLAIQSASAYEIGVHYQPSYWAGEWGMGNWLYPPLMSASNNGQEDKGGFNGLPNQRVPRAYPERQPLVNGQPKWLDVWNQTDVNAEVDSMKQAGIDHMIYQTPWARNGDPAVPYGFTGYKLELDNFIQANYSRATNNQVRFSLMFVGEKDLNYQNRQDFIHVFETKVQFAINEYFWKTDSQGNRLYYFRDGKPMLTFWDTGDYMSQAHSYGVTMLELIQRSQQLAIAAGYSGIYWLDSANTIVNRSFQNASYGTYTVQDYVTYQDMIAEADFNAETGYNYQGVSGVAGTGMNFTGYNAEIKAYVAIWNGLITGARNHSGFKHFPLVNPGWDSRAIGEYDQATSTHDRSRSCDGAFDSFHNSEALAWGCSTDNALFATLLRKAKYKIDANQDVTDNMVIVGTWNDLLEGTYIIPTVGDGGAHARILRNVFKPNNQNISVYYGKTDRFKTIVLNAGNSVFCDNSQFGGDPVPNVVKACYDEFGNKMANEGSWYNVNSNVGAIPVSIKFGTPTANVTNVITVGTVFQCSYMAFGSDPAPGQAKACYDDMGTLIATEGQSFVVPF